MKPADALVRLDQARARMARLMTIERLAPVVRTLALVLFALGFIGLLGVWQALHPLAHTLFALVAICTFAVALVWAFKTYHKPTLSEVDRRLSDISPNNALIDSLDDRPSGGDLVAHRVWKEHQERAAKRADTFQAPGRFGAFKALDPWGIRWALLAALIAGAFFAGKEAQRRFLDAYSPPWGTLFGDGRLTFDVWATPPAYTGQGAIYLAGRAATGSQLPSIPEGSTVSVRVFGAKGAPMLIVRDKAGVRRLRFKSLGGGFEAQAPVNGATVLQVRRFGTRASWQLKVTDDLSPVVAFTNNPTVGENERVHFAWRASDDFGLNKLWLTMRLVNPGLGPESSNRDEIEIPLPGANTRLAQASERLDVLAHPFAGLKVEARMVAIDALGQRGESKPFEFTLPELEFANPLALAIIEARRHLIRERRQYSAHAVQLFNSENERLDRAPDGVKRSARLVEAMTLEPTQYFADPSIFLGLRYALAQMNNARTIEEAHVAGGTLWNIALKVEFGDAAEAEQKLEAAKEALKKAIRDGADSRTLDRLALELKEALKNAINAKAAEALANPESKETAERDTPPPQQQTKTIDEKEIDQMLEEIKNDAKRGDQQAAQDKLDKLGQMMDKLAANAPPGDQEKAGKEGEQSSAEKQQQLEKALEDLGELMDKQSQLADETFQKAQEGGGGGDDKMSKEQGEVAGELSKAAGKAGKQAGSESLDAAEMAMKAAQQAIAKGDYGTAMGRQAEALNQMRKGAMTLSKAKNAASAKGEKDAGNKDPLGRKPGSGVGDGREVRVPDAAERQRSQEILDEIKRRAARADADPVERSYLERLLERF